MYISRPSPPADERTLLSRANMLAGMTLAELASRAGLPLPANLRRDKGWIGTLLEWHLGANAASRAQPDFAHLGIELKTIPIDQRARPLETTFVCVVPLINNTGLDWYTSYVRQKLARVLWFPVEGERHLPLGSRRLCAPLIWSPDEHQDSQLRRDWEELMEYIVLGQVERITAHHGEVLQIRPKAANSRAVTRGIGRQGEAIMTLPRGFYLRKSFTHVVLARHFLL